MIWAKNGKKNFQHQVGLWIQIKTILKTASTMHDFPRGSVAAAAVYCSTALVVVFVLVAIGCSINRSLLVFI